MADRKKTSGILLYNLLMREVTAASERMPEGRQLTVKQRRALISDKLFEKFNAVPKSKRRIGDIRKSIQWHVSRAATGKRKKWNNAQLYNLLLQEVTAANNELPESRKLSMAERRGLISDKLFDRFKDLPKSRVRLTEIRALVRWHVSRFKKKKEEIECDVLSLPPESLLDIDYFRVDEYIQELPKCLYIKVNASQFGFGETKVFNTRDYSYYSLGVSDITNKINEWVRGLPKGVKVYPWYDGIIQLRKGKKNDGQSDNYYIEFFLQTEEKKSDYQPVVVPQRKGKRKVSKRKAEAIRKKAIKERTKRLSSEKAYIKSLKRSFRKNVRDYKTFEKTAKKYKIPTAKIQKENYNREKKRADKFLKNGKITKADHRTLIEIITEGYNQ